MIGKLDVRGSGSAWAVYNNGTRVSRYYRGSQRAEDAATRIEIEQKTKIRPCITCRDVFESTHSGHRMCNPCRSNPLRFA